MSTNTTAPSYINSAEDANASDELIATSAQPTEPWNVNTSISSADVPDPELTPESVPGETARIHAALSHPYFSNHPTQTSASGVGDIVIDNRTKKTHRLALSRGKVVGIVITLLVVVVVGIVAANKLTPAFSKPSRATVSKSYDEFSNFLKTGSDNSNDREKWFIDDLTDDSLDVSQTNDAIKQIYELYDNFVAKFNGSDLVDKSDLNQDILNESVLLTLIATYSNLKTVVNDLTEEFLDDDNQTSIEDLVNRTLPAQTYSDKQDAFREALSKYLITKLQMVEFYDNSYCYYDGILLDGDCVALLDIDEAYVHLAKVNELAALYLRQDKAGILDELHNQTNNLQEAFK